MLLSHKASICPVWAYSLDPDTSIKAYGVPWHQQGRNTKLLLEIPPLLYICKQISQLAIYHFRFEVSSKAHIINLGPSVHSSFSRKQISKLESN